VTVCPVEVAPRRYDELQSQADEKAALRAEILARHALLTTLVVPLTTCQHCLGEIREQCAAVRARCVELREHCAVLKGRLAAQRQRLRASTGGRP
jgi:hypothetical protein